MIEDITFSVSDLSGKSIYREEMKDVSGLRTITLDARDFAPGVYFYTVANGADRVTRKMIVAR